MTYLELAAWFFGAAVVLAVVLSVLSRGHRPHLAAIVLTAVVLVALTAVFDTAMIAAGLFHYSPGHLLGVHIGLAPLEDFAYPLAGAVLLPATWAFVHGRRARRTASAEGERA